MTYKIEDVFSPRSFPQNTYISRRLNEYETIDTKFKKALAMKGNLIFVVGASKSGKTVLCHSAIPKDNIINLSGSHIGTRKDFWDHIAEQIPLSYEVTISNSISSTDSTGTSDGVTAGANVLGFNVGANIGSNNTTVNNSQSQVTATNIRTEGQITRYLIENSKVLVIDDFHYIAKDVQLYVARILKTELFNGLNAVIVSLPHRSDEAITLNSDLTGRTTTIAIPDWTCEELKEIALKGFGLLGIEVTEEQINLLARESISSPQLMQDNCFALAYMVSDYNKLNGVTNEMVKQAFFETASNYGHYNRLVEAIKRGPSRGSDRRKEYMVNNGSVDIYGLVLLALKEDPPVTQMSVDELKDRFRRILGVDVAVPNTSTLSAIINKIVAIVKEIMPDLDALEYKEKYLYILDPFLLFYMRWCGK